MTRIFGEIDGQSEGSEFTDRKALARAGVHRPPQAGISGSATEGADSVVVNGGYEDDEDYGDLIIYTGAGGREPNTGKQISDQQFTGVNAALAKSFVDGLPVRVVRGTGTTPPFATGFGYRYDGLYRVDEYWLEKGRSAFKVCRFRLVKQGGIKELQGSIEIPGTPVRRKTSVQRIVRSTEIARRVKVLHNYHCQICGIRLDTPAGPYAESAHIRPLGRPHDGPDTESNILCLCPNDHVKFDCLAVAILDELDVIDVSTGTQYARLTEITGHRIDKAHIRYHRRLCGL